MGLLLNRRNELGARVMPAEHMTRSVIQCHRQIFVNNNNYICRRKNVPLLSVPFRVSSNCFFVSISINVESIFR